MHGAWCMVQGARCKQGQEPPTHHKGKGCHDGTRIQPGYPIHPPTHPPLAAPLQISTPHPSLTTPQTSLLLSFSSPLEFLYTDIMALLDGIVLKVSLSLILFTTTHS